MNLESNQRITKHYMQGNNSLGFLIRNRGGEKIAELHFSSAERKELSTLKSMFSENIFR